MNPHRGRVVDIADRQHGCVAFWQLRAQGLERAEAQRALRGLPRAFRGVCALRDLDLHGWLMAATLALGPGAAISHLTALQLRGLRPWEPGPIHVSVPRGGGRSTRDGLEIHRRLGFDSGTYEGIPVTTQAQSLIDADLQSHQLYRAIEQAERSESADALPLNEMFELRRRVHGRTRSDAEARFIVLCHEHGLKLPRVNHRLNGFESDFHWHAARLVAEVDGYEHHHERPQFEEDRRRGVAHRIAGFEVIRFSALQVFNDSTSVVAALLSAAPSLADPMPQLVHERPRAAQIWL